MSTTSTGIDELDRLLGGGFAPGTVVLLRGGPGSGKTTLGLQLIDRHLTRAIQSADRDKSEVGAAVFLSLEVEPTRALTHVNESFGFFSSVLKYVTKDVGRILRVDPRLIAWGRDDLDVKLEMKRRQLAENRKEQEPKTRP